MNKMFNVVFFTLSISCARKSKPGPLVGSTAKILESKNIGWEV